MVQNFAIILSVIMTLTIQIQSYKLKQVLILSRHNIRSPIIKNLQFLSPYEFPHWEEDAAHLTDKGRRLEEYMGDYFHNWIVEQKLLLEQCPKRKEILIYANTKQRTRETAKAFARKAFKNCDVEVFSINSEEMDPIFNPVPLNSSLDLKTVIVNEMQQKLDELNLQDSYAELNKILNLKQSSACKEGNICDFNERNNEILYEIGSEPNIRGPLDLGNLVVDSFLMGYYEGMPLEKVAWGQIKTEEQWKLLTRITKENQNVRFNSTVLAKEVARPLLNYILGVFDSNNPPKFTLLVGHDSNLNPVMASFGFVTSDLPGQHERTPVGGKLVFQKIEDDSGKEFMKFDFVYQSFEQLRLGTKLSMENPPMWYPMYIKDCSDENLYCPWDSFIDILRNIVSVV